LALTLTNGLVYLIDFIAISQMLLAKCSDCVRLHLASDFAIIALWRACIDTRLLTGGQAKPLRLAAGLF
jgi:hypothetical protein